MDVFRLNEPDIRSFILKHENDDVAALGLKKPPHSDWPYPLILNQIKVRRRAREKTPSWHEVAGVIFPDDNVFQQASSEACARFKSSVLSGKILVDLTGGVGVDAWYLVQGFARADIVERDEYTHSVLAHNMQVLQAHNESHVDLSVHHAMAEDFLTDMPHVSAVYIDPQRRNEARKGLYDFSTLSPDITALLPMLKEKSDKVLIKASPLLDIEKALVDLGCVTYVYVVQWRGECKEVLYLIDFAQATDIHDVVIKAVDLDDHGEVQKEFSYTIAREKAVQVQYSLPQKYIYEPGAAFQKCGGFSSMAEAFGLDKLHPHTHVYTSDELRPDFAGKCYELIDILPVKAAALKERGVTKADLKLRNFTGTPEALKKKIKIKDGGIHRIFAVTLIDDSKKLLLCRK